MKRRDLLKGMAVAPAVVAVPAVAANDNEPTMKEMQASLDALTTMVSDIWKRLDLDASTPNVYGVDADMIKNNEFTLVKTDNGDGTFTVIKTMNTRQWMNP